MKLLDAVTSMIKSGSNRMTYSIDDVSFPEYLWQINSMVIIEKELIEFSLIKSFLVDGYKIEITEQTSIDDNLI